ncbi:MAG: hypothetical protein ACK480_02575 [Planctomycetota bacterium]
MFDRWVYGLRLLDTMFHLCLSYKRLQKIDLSLVIERSIFERVSLGAN